MEREEIFNFNGEEEEEEIDIVCGSLINFFFFFFTKQKSYFYIGYSNKEDEDFDQIVGCLQEIVLEPAFEKNQNLFFKKNCHIFEDSEENKIEYMEIFKTYQALIENSIYDVNQSSFI